jgi:hypothetical protein
MTDCDRQSQYAQLMTRRKLAWDCHILMQLSLSTGYLSWPRLATLSKLSSQLYPEGSCLFKIKKRAYSVILFFSKKTGMTKFI